jgi:molybdate transport system substrate-binding protein
MFISIYRIGEKMVVLPRRMLLKTCGVAAVLPARRAGAEERAPVVAAAADLTYALPEIAAAFARAQGHVVKLVFGSSGNFAAQIRNGAPFEVFLSADEDYVVALAGAGRTDGAGVLYAEGRIGVFVRGDAGFAADPALQGLATALRAGKLKKFAIANPAHAPYGRAAQAALEHGGLWEAVRPHLVLGENVAQAAQFMLSGAAQAGIIPLSLARAPVFAAAGDFALIAASWHPPLRQRMVLLKSAGPVARAFYAYLQGPEARAVFRRFGFVLPGEAAADG